MQKRLDGGRKPLPRVTSGVALDILSDAGGPLASKVMSALRNGYYDEIVNQSQPDPRSYACHETFARDYLAYHLLRKYPGFDLGIDRKAVALDAFCQSEDSCRTLNRFNGRLPMTFDSDEVPLHQSLEAVIHTAKQKIQRLLGPFDWNEVSRKWRFSGGASTRLKRRSGDLYYKLQGRPHVTRECALLAVCAIWHNEGWRKLSEQAHGPDPFNWVEIVPGSKYTTVPKSAKTDRGICIEPEMNMFFQLGIGACIRSRLKTVRVDLDDQTYNQYLARCGSSTGSLATIDLKSASDSIALETVRMLLPSDWFDALYITRSHNCEVEGTWRPLHKISSMGNGFTFELESLIFWAISSSVVELVGCEDTRLGIYGDDIIVHHSAAPRLISVLGSLGFETNKDKTFVDGPFRESCGKHYFYGFDVSPFSITEDVDGPNRLFLHWNQCASWWIPLERAMERIRQRLPNGMRQQYVPHYESEESGMKVPWDVARPRWSRRHQQWWYARLVPRRRKFRPNGPYALLSWLLRYSNKLPENCYVLEKGDVRYCRSFGRTSQWDALVG